MNLEDIEKALDNVLAYDNEVLSKFVNECDRLRAAIERAVARLERWDAERNGCISDVADELKAALGKRVEP